MCRCELIFHVVHSNLGNTQTNDTGGRQITGESRGWGVVLAFPSDDSIIFIRNRMPKVFKSSSS